MVKEWGISNTTLEEVFLRLIAQTKEVNANTGGNTDGLGGEDAVVQYTPIMICLVSKQTTRNENFNQSIYIVPQAHL